MGNTKTTDEIDLLELLAKFFRSIRKNIIAALLFPLLGAVLCLALSYMTETKIQSKMLIVTDLLSKEEGKFLIEQLQKADTFPNLTKEQFRKIYKIDPKVIEKEPGSTDARVFIEVTAEVSDPGIFPVLQKTIVTYLNTSEPVIRMRKTQTLLYTEMIRKIDAELKAMDQVKHNVNEQKNNTYLDPSELFAKSVDLYQRRTNYQIALDDLKSVRVAKGFSTLMNNVKLSKVLVVIIGLAIGAIGFLVYLALKSFSEYYQKFEETV